MAKAPRFIVSVPFPTGASLPGCNAEVTFEQADAAARNGEYEKAIELFSKLARTSSDPAIFGNRGNCYSYLGNLDAAIADYQATLDLLPKGPLLAAHPLAAMTYYNRGTAYARSKKYQLAVADFEKTIELRPDYPDVKNSLAWLLATCADPSLRNPSRAIELAREELSKSPDSPQALDTVAACFAVGGDFLRAISSQEQALSLCADPQRK